MKRSCLLATMLAAIAIASVALGDDDSIFERRDDDLITERRDDDLIEPLDPARREPSLLQGTEEALDRGEGRLQDQAMHELDRLEREIDGERLFDDFQRERDRNLRQEKRRRQETKRSEKIYERESDRLAPERQAYLRSIGRISDAAAAGAADDFRKLTALREQYERDLENLDSEQARARRTERYESERRTILGVPAPSTQPTTQPAEPSS